MFRLVVLTCVVAACAAQNAVDPKDAKILKEQRFNVGDGRAGASFATEDGTVFKEETDESGNRIGQYSYVGSDGITYNVKYSAGKDGFRILSGDHIPSGGQTAAAFDAAQDDEEELEQPLQQQQPQQAQPQQPQQQRPLVPQAPALRAQVQQEAPTDPNANPFINPHDPTHLNFQQNQNAKSFAPNSPHARVASLVPPCADCAGVDPFVNPFDNSHRAGGNFDAAPAPAAGHLAGHLAGHQAGVPQQQPQLRAAPSAQQQQQQPLLPQQTSTTPATKRFFPPGQLSLNRFETGFNFDFES